MANSSIDAATREATERLVNALHPEKIILFGSHAWGTPHESSDLDLFVIVCASDLPPHKRAQMAYRSLAGLGTPCDVLVYTHEEVERVRRVKASLTHRVLKEGKVLYG